MDVEEYRKKRYSGIDQKLVHRKETKIIERFLGEMTGGDLLLDIPCGYGRFSGIFLKRGFRLTSGDISLPMVLLARKHSPANTGQNFLVADIANLPLKEKSYDCVVVIRLFQHILDPSTRLQILRELNRVTRKAVIISFYRRNVFHIIERWLRCKIKRNDKKLSILSLGNFKREVEASGFRVVDIVPVNRYFHCQHIAFLSRRTGM